MFTGKTVLITGGTGSFGQQCTRTLLRYKPAKIIIFSRDELKQFEMQQEFNAPCMRYCIGDVRDYGRIKQAMHGVDYVIHAAALKQVPAAEYNPTECIRTNVHGAENIIHAALENEVDRVMALSTDKAASPNSLYGATKLVADKLFVAANNIAGSHKTIFASVRYGNVVGSRGSVVPHFKHLIDKGVSSLPITHPDMTRFWITLQQGIDFVLKDFARMRGGEIFIPKIPSIRIVDLATAMAPHLVTHIIGVRPGEKLHEAMFTTDDSNLTIEFTDHFVIQPSIRLHERDVDFHVNELGEKGTPCPPEFEYISNRNPHFLSVEEIKHSVAV